MRVARSREDRIAKTLLIVDTALDHVDDDLGNGAQRAELARVPELVRLAELLSGEATDRVSFDEMQAGFRALLEIASRYVPKAKREQFLAEVNEALGATG